MIVILKYLSYSFETKNHINDMNEGIMICYEMHEPFLFKANDNYEISLI